MAKGKPRLTRLAAIATQLQSKRLVTAREIADRHEVSIRTVYRDIRTLEESGIPIVTEEGKGYSIVDGYTLPPVMFTEEEALALVTAEHLLLTNKDQSLREQYSSALTKIKSTLRVQQKEKTEFLADRIQVRRNHRDDKTSNYLIQLQSTITDFLLVELTYLSLQNERTQRTIEPFALYTTQQNWVLVAYCRKRRAFRAFRLDRIEDLRVQEAHFTPHNMTLEEYLESCRKKSLTTPDIPLTHLDNTFATDQKPNDMQQVQVAPFKMIGLAIRTSNADGQAAQEIGALWNEFLSSNALAKIPNRMDDTVYSLYTDYVGDHTQPYTVVLGCQVTQTDEIPEGMVARSFSGGEYVKMSARGNLQEGIVVKQWQKIWTMDLKRAYTADFEVFGAKARNPEDAEVDFFIAVQNN
ncbi:MAG: effector binding domain-containing protein [Bacteroidota bacterium]